MRPIRPAVSLACLLSIFTGETLATTNASDELVYQFPNGTFVENVAVRANGNLLVSLVNVPELWEINPSLPDAASRANRIQRFNGSTMATGIAEVRPDVFSVSSGSEIYLVDMNASPPAVKPFASLQDTSLNGMAFLPAPSGSKVLVGDTSAGLVWSVDLDSAAYTIALWDETMFPVPGVRTSLVGVNGLRYESSTGYLHYVNLSKELYCRVRIDPVTARAIGPYEIVRGGTMADDFALVPDGSSTVYLAGLDTNVIRKVGSDGRSEVVAGSLNSSAVAGATSAAFGRLPGDEQTLFVTTGGAQRAPVNGTYSEGGKVVAVRLDVV